MSVLFFKANFDMTISFLDDHDPSEWDNFEKENEVYQTINFEIKDPEDPMSPVLIHVANREILSGSFICTKLSEKLYKFSIVGIFKTSVHKDGIRLLNSGVKPILDGITRNGQGWSFYEDFQPVVSNTDWYFSSKKSEIMGK